LPYGLKLSNRLPNVKIKDYKLTFVDALNNKSYFVKGEKFKIADFVLDKKIKLSTTGQVVHQINISGNVINNNVVQSIS
jgi:hypothetical protein